MAYVLLVRDLASGVNRKQIDDALSGFTVDSVPAIDEYNALPQPSIEELRETWGANPEAIESKQALDAMMGRVGKDGRIIGTGSG